MVLSVLGSWLYRGARMLYVPLSVLTVIGKSDATLQLPWSCLAKQQQREGGLPPMQSNKYGKLNKNAVN